MKRADFIIFILLFVGCSNSIDDTLIISPLQSVENNYLDKYIYTCQFTEYSGTILGYEINFIEDSLDYQITQKEMECKIIYKFAGYPETQYCNVKIKIENSFGIQHTVFTNTVYMPPNFLGKIERNYIFDNNYYNETIKFIVILNNRCPIEVNEPSLQFVSFSYMKKCSIENID